MPFLSRLHYSAGSYLYVWDPDCMYCNFQMITNLSGTVSLRSLQHISTILSSALYQRHPSWRTSKCEQIFLFLCVRTSVLKVCAFSIWQSKYFFVSFFSFLLYWKRQILENAIKLYSCTWSSQNQPGIYCVYVYSCFLMRLENARKLRVFHLRLSQLRVQG